jgi:hypothetical protein
MSPAQIAGLAQFDSLPNDAIVNDRVAAAVLGMSVWTLRRNNPVPARQLSGSAAVVLATCAPKPAAPSLQRLPEKHRTPRGAGLGRQTLKQSRQPLNSTSLASWQRAVPHKKGTDDEISKPH